MKIMNTEEMRTINGGYWYCKVCGYKNFLKAIVFNHVIWSGHWMGKK